MSKILWDQIGEKRYETGVDHGVLYLPDNTGVYDTGFGWNGLVTVTESPSGAEANPQYADNIKYLNLISAEEFGATIEAFTYPDEFEQCDGTAEVAPGVKIGQQNRKSFGMSYRTLIGNDTQGTDFGYKIHLVWNALAAPTEKAFGTVNDSPEAITFSWEVTTTPVDVPGFKPSATMVIDSTKVDADALEDLLDILYGTAGTDPRLPTPAEVIDLFEGTTQTAVPVSPTFVAGTGVITLPAITGLRWIREPQGNTVSGTYTIPTPGATQIIKAVANAGYILDPTKDDDFMFTRTP